MTETKPRAKHTPEEIRENHLNAALRSVVAAGKRVAKVETTREKVKEQARTIDSEHAAALAVLNGARERYRHAHLIARGEQPAEWPEGTAPETGDEGVEVDPHDVPDSEDEDEDSPFNP